MAYNAKTGQWVPDEKMGDFPTYGANNQVVPSVKSGSIKSINSSLNNLSTRSQAPASIDYKSLGYTGAYELGEGDTVDPKTGAILRANGFQNAGPYQTFSGPGGAYSNTGGKSAFDAAQQKYQQAVVDSGAAKKDLSKIQTDFQSILAGLQNKQNYNQSGLDVVNSVVDLMKSKGIADTSVTARQQLAQQAGISDYNPNNAESNKRLAEAILGSKAVGSAMSQLQPGTPEYNSALTTVTGTVAKANQAAQPPVIPPAEKLTSIGTKVSEDPMMAEYDRITNEIDSNNSSITSALNQLRNGAIPLTADQQAVVDSTQQSFNNAINQQKEANKVQENVVRRSSFRSGSEYTPEVSSSIIKNVIDSNILKISEYDQRAIATVAELKQNFKDANYKAIKENYDSLQKTLKDKQDNLMGLMKMSHDYEKESLAYNLDVLRYKETVRSNMASEAIAGIKATTGNSTYGGYDDEQNKVINSVNTTIANSQVYKRVNNVNGFVESALANLKNNTGASDIAAINQFQKVVDEGAVTRDKDVELLQSAQSLKNSLLLKIKKLEKGEQLSPELREQMKQSMLSMQKAAVAAVNDDPFIKSQVSRLERYKIDPVETIVGEISQKYGETGQPVEVTADTIKSLMDQGYSNAQIQEWIKSQKSFNQVGSGTNQASKGIVAGYDIKSYATDPKHEVNVASIYSKIPQVSTATAIDNYIKRVAKNSPVTGQAVVAAAQKYNVDPKMILAIMVQDSTLGTAGKAVRTKNPGNVGNDDTGALRTYQSWDDGVMAVAKNLAWRKVA